ncbi:hypothetical protein Tco_1129812 [Tanacetum coccineum]
MKTLQFADTHNLVPFLAKPAESRGFEQVVDFLNASSIRYALTVNPTIYTSCIEQFWATVKVKTVNGEQQTYKLEDAEGVDFLPNATIFEQLTLMGSEKISQKLTFYKTTTWNEFSSTIASAIICLATNQKFNFSKYIFESMVKNLDNVGKSLMYPRFIQVFLDKQLEGMSSHKRIYVTPSHTKKIFRNMKRIDEAVNEEMDDSLVRAVIIASSLEAEQDNGGGPRRQETMEDIIAHTRSENVSKLSNDLLLARGNILQSGEDCLKLQELMALCTTLQSRVLNLETTKTIQANEIASLKRRVKKLEKKNKSRTHKLKRLYKVSLRARVESFRDEESLGEDASKQGRRITDIDDDEDITLVNDQIDADAEMFNVDTLTGLKRLKVQEKGDVIKEPSVPVSTVTSSTKDSAATTTTATIPTPRKGIVFQEPAKFDEEVRLAREKAEKEQEANVALTEEWDDIQA